MKTERRESRSGGLGKFLNFFKENNFLGLNFYVSPEKRNLLRSMEFTLLELLVVISVIIILAGLLLPSLRKAREQVRKISCANNISQIGKGFMFYANDYQDYLPPYRDHGNPEKFWYYGTPASGFIAEYLGKNDPYIFIASIGMSAGKMRRDKFACPSEAEPAGATRVYTYGYNECIYNYSSRKISTFRKTSMLCLLSENMTPVSSYSGLYPVRFRHVNGANVLFCDYHVSWKKMIEIPDQTIDGTASVNPFWKVY